MGLGYLEFIYTDSCYSGMVEFGSDGHLHYGDPGERGMMLGNEYSTHSDLTAALHMKLENPNEWIYQFGWYDKAIVGTGVTGTSYQLWTQTMWEKLGEGNLMLNAVQYATDKVIQIFGPNEKALKDFRFKGFGYLESFRIPYRQK